MMEYLEDTKGLIKKSPKKIKNINMASVSKRKNSESFVLNLNNNVLNAFKNKNNIIIGICGGQSCGKSLISSYIDKLLEKTEILSEKDFFIGNKERRKSNVDDKINVLQMTDDDYSTTRKNRLAEINNYNNFDFESLIRCLTDFSEGKTINIPTWDKEKGNQIPDYYAINAKEISILILEGQFIFYNEEVRNLLSLRLYVETDDDIRLARMLIKENEYLKDRAPAMKSFFTIYEDYIKPCYIKYIESSKKHAHIIVPNYEFNSSLEIEEISVLNFLVFNLDSIRNSNNNSINNN